MKKKEKENLFYATQKISGINFKVFSSKKGIRNIFLNKNSTIKNVNTTRLRADDPFMFNVFTQLEEYFKGERKKFNLPIDLKGTSFQKKVWNELNKIPYGKIVSYKKIAEKTGFKVAYHQLEFRGLCRECLKNQQVMKQPSRGGTEWVKH